MNNKTKLANCIDLYLYLYRHQGVLHTAKHLADEMDISLRSVRRYLDVLIDYDKRIMSVRGRGGGVIFRK